MNKETRKTLHSTEKWVQVMEKPEEDKEGKEKKRENRTASPDRNH